MNTVCPTNGIESEWQEARERLDAYLRAMNLHDKEQRERIVSIVLAQAAVRHGQGSAKNPTALVMNEMWELSEKWLEKCCSRERASVNGLVSLFVIDAAQKWPSVFLAENVPVELQQVLRNCDVNAAPDLRVTRMVPQPFESPLTDIDLPTALGQLTKQVSPSFVAKVVIFVLSGFTIWSGNRIR